MNAFIIITLVFMVLQLGCLTSLLGDIKELLEDED